MRVFCLERDNVTQLCDPDSDGDMYTSSFEFFPFHEGATYSLYMGVYNGNGPYAGQFCTVRGLLDIEAGQANWQEMLSRAREAQRLAHEFNKELAYPAIFFNVPTLTRMESVSDFNGLFRCFRPHDKRLKSGEYVTLEPYLEGNFQQFDQVASDKYTPLSIPQPGEPDIIEQAPTAPMSVFASKHKNIESTSNIAQAFTHFTWHTTGSLIVCGLQGTIQGLTYTLTNPRIHSLTSSYGTTDGSAHGIADFFRSHRCNNICRGWGRYLPHRNIHPQVNFLHSPVSDSLLQVRQKNQPQQEQVSRSLKEDKYAGFHHKNLSQDQERTHPSAPELTYPSEENPFNSFV